MPKFEVVVGASTKSPEQAALAAERKATKAGGEQIGIAADVCCGAPGTDDRVIKLLNNIATNIFRCDCKTTTVIAKDIKKISQGVAPPIVPTTGAKPSPPLWVVYILIRH